MNHIITILAATGNAEVPISWFIATIGSLGGLVSLLARIIYVHLTTQIGQLREEIKQLSKGCGITTCHWRDFPKP